MALQNITQLFTPNFLNDSVLTKTLGEEFVLCENGNLVFHWADYFETCDLIKSQLENSPTLMSDFKNRENALNRLSTIPVWIRTEKKVHQSTMFELYERYILNQFDLLGGIDPFSPLEISFISGTGPFKGMSVAECFNKSTYRDFILVYLIQGKLPRRDYRIRLKSKILVEHGSDFESAQLVALEQLTVNGMLLSMESSDFVKYFSKEDSIRLLINGSVLAKAKDMSLVQIKEHLSQFAFNLLYSSHKDDSISVKVKDLNVQSSFDFSKNKRVFIFVDYSKFSESKTKGISAIRGFVEQTKILVREHYQKDSQKEKTA